MRYINKELFVNKKFLCKKRHEHAMCVTNIKKVIIIVEKKNANFPLTFLFTLYRIRVQNCKNNRQTLDKI